jgi:protein-disulfide isomerase
LDVVATLALLAAAGVVIWTHLARSSPAAAPSRRPISVPTEPVSLEGAPILGNRDARVVLLEFSDFECPFCGRFSNNILPEIKANYVNTGKVSIAFRHLPLDRIHSRARGAAEAAECASRQGKFWPFHDLMFSNPRRLSATDLLEHADTAGLDLVSFARCLDGEAADHVQRDTKQAATLGLSSTPSFLVGTLRSDGRLQASAVISGARPASDFADSFDSLLRAVK